MALGVRTVIKISNVSIRPYEEGALPSLEIAIEITLSKDKGAIVGLSGPAQARAGERKARRAPPARI